MKPCLQECNTCTLVIHCRSLLQMVQMHVLINRGFSYFDLFASLPGAHLSGTHEISFLAKTAVAKHAIIVYLHTRYIVLGVGIDLVHGKATHMCTHMMCTCMQLIKQQLDGSDEDCFDYTPTAELLKLNESAVWQYS